MPERDRVGTLMTDVDLISSRTQRLRQSLDHAGYDWLVVGNPENVRYATGYGSVMGDLIRAPKMAALVSSHDLWLVGPCADSAAALDGGFPDDRYVAFGRFYFESAGGDATPTRMVDDNADFHEALTAALQRASVRGVVAVDGAVSENAGDLIRGLHGVDRVVDADRWALGVRARKLPGEIERLRQAAGLAEAGIAAAMAEAKAGSTEQELARVVAAMMAEGGGIPRFVVVTAGHRSALADARPTNNTLVPGHLLRFDVGCVYDGYWSDVGRTAVLGEPDELQERRYAAILAGEDRQLEILRPGVRAGQLFDAAVTVVEEEGLIPYRRHHCGHGIGMEIYEPPIVAPGWDQTLDTDMTFCLETPFYELGWGGMMVEDMVIVTDGGHERLTTSGRDLRVIEP